MIKYSEYVIKELFDIHPTKAYKYTNAELFHKDGTTPVVTNTSKNHGRSGYSNFQPTEANIITFSDTGTKSPDSFFYQEGSFIGYAHVQGMYPYSKKWSKNSLLYLIALLKSKTAGEYDYSTKMTREDILNMKVVLPVDIDNNIDFAYMEDYISKLEEERISELEKERNKKLENYLCVSGFDNCNLSAEEKYALYQFQKNLFKKRRYKIGGETGLFELTTTKKKFNANSVTFNGTHPYVARSSVNNGIRGHIDQDPAFLNEANTISFGQDTATMFFQEKPYFTGDKIKVLKYKDRPLTSRLACYLIANMRKAFSSFSWGQTSFNEDILNNVEITMPVTEKGDIDYLFIDLFMRVQEKLSIKDVVDWKDKIISVTKKVCE